MDSPSSLSQLARVEHLEVDTSDRALHEARADKSGHRSDSAPLAVVYPSTIEAVQTVMRWATEHRVPVVTRGGGSGLAGGAIGSDGEIVLSLERLNRILEISISDRLARVEAGVINADLNAAAQEHGLWFGPDPASRAWSTVGGNIATNAGGLLCAKYGVTREAVLALTVVLADGRVIHPGHRSVKGVTGLDLTQLFIGSEGLLGIIVEATVKLLPTPHTETWTLAARFSDIAAATDACEDITSSGHTPAILELVDNVALGPIHEYLGLEAPEPTEVLLIAQSDSPDAAGDIATFAAVCERHGARTDSHGPGPEAEALLQLRRSMHPAMEQHGTVLIEDVAVPLATRGDVPRGPPYRSRTKRADSHGRPRSRWQPSSELHRSWRDRTRAHLGGRGRTVSCSAGAGWHTHRGARCRAVEKALDSRRARRRPNRAPPGNQVGVRPDEHSQPRQNV